MSEVELQAGWDREQANRIMLRSMHILSKCVDQTEVFLNDWLQEVDEEFTQHWEEAQELVKTLQEHFLKHQNGKKSEIRAQFNEIKRLNSLLYRLNTILGSNPVEMVKLAEKLASLNQKTLQMGVLVAKEYGDLSEKKSTDEWFKWLNPDQIAYLFQCVEENKALAEVMGGDS